VRKLKRVPGRIRSPLHLKRDALAKKRKQLDGRQAVMQGFAEAAAEQGQHFFYIRIP
jgi:hypothetical protein